MVQKGTSSKISVIIATYNRTQKALRLAENISDQYPDIEIVVVDQLNDREIDIKNTNIKYFNLEKANLSAARNFGIEKANGEILIFLDDDVEITKNTIPNHLKNYDDIDVVGVAGRVINDGEKIFDGNDLDTGKTNFLHTKFVQNFVSNKKQTVDFAYGCNMSYRKTALQKVGGFDVRFSKIFDEIDIGVRISQFGKINFDPDALVYHHKAISGGIRDEEKKNKNKMIYLYYGYFLRKNVLFPFSLISLVMRTVTVLRECPYAIVDLYKGYLKILKN